jgi:MFS family permease
VTGDARRLPSASRQRFGYWAVGYALLVVFMLTSASSPLYVLYARRDHFSSFMLTLIYGAYAIGVIGSLLLVSHLSDVHGRRPHLLTAMALAVLSAIVFVGWPDIPGLFAARVLCGVSVGLTTSTATAYISESHRARHPGSSGTWPQLTATAANLGGLGLGALTAGLLAQYESHPLVLPYLVLLGMLVLAEAAVALSAETRARQRPLPAYRPQRMSVPHDARSQFFAALTGIFLSYAGLAIFLGLAGTFLATAVHDKSLAAAGVTIFVVYAVGVPLLAATSTWPLRRLLAAGAALDIIGLALVVAAAWLPAPSLTLFLTGGGAVGAGAAFLFKGTLGSIVAISPAHRLGEALAGFFLLGYIGLSLPAIAIGIALQFVTPRVTLLAFAVIVSGGILGASRLLLTARQEPGQPQPAVLASGADRQHSRMP